MYNSMDESFRGRPQLSLPILDLPNPENISQERKEDSQLAGPLCTSCPTLENALDAPVQRKSQGRSFESQPKSVVTNFTHKYTNATWISGFPMENVEL